MARPVRARNAPQRCGADTPVVPARAKAAPKAAPKKTAAGKGGKGECRKANGGVFCKKNSKYSKVAYKKWDQKKTK